MVFVTFVPICQFAQGQEIVYDSNSADFGSLSYWPFWGCRWHRNNGYPKDGKGLVSTRKNQQYRVPLRPPVDGSSFGYYQPCWRQLPVVPRCLTCETESVHPDMKVPEVVSPYPIPGVPPAPNEPTAVETKPNTQESKIDSEQPKLKADKPEQKTIDLKPLENESP
jgi:hypothetical protein